MKGGKAINYGKKDGSYSAVMSSGRERTEGRQSSYLVFCLSLETTFFIIFSNFFFSFGFQKQSAFDKKQNELRQEEGYFRNDAMI
jgi:hypothetical protein